MEQFEKMKNPPKPNFVISKRGDGTMGVEGEVSKKCANLHISYFSYLCQISSTQSNVSKQLVKASLLLLCDLKNLFNEPFTKLYGIIANIRKKDNLLSYSKL